tara:strand:- start:708 stop:2081 length:1374 start_codon:yes stop_codon:yes gene_type:complete
VEYFNKKEDVLDIELTPFGELLLSQGEFKPEYYAFYDDGILYDANYAGVSETQNEVKKRIKETPRLKTQYQFRGGEFPKHVTQKVVMETPGQEIAPATPGTYGPDVITEQKECRLGPFTREIYNIFKDAGHGSSFVKDGALYWTVWMSEQESQELYSLGVKNVPNFSAKSFCKVIEGTAPGEYIPGTPPIFGPEGVILEHKYPNPAFAANVLSLPLGRCNYDTSFAPAWDLKMLYNEIEGPVEMYTSSMHPYLKIPQISVDVVYESYIGPSNKTANPDESKYKLKELKEIHDKRYVYKDGNSIYFDEDFIVLEINEENVPYLKENFDIEVFKVSESVNIRTGEKEETLTPLSFVKRSPTVVDENGLLMNFEDQLAAQEKDYQLQMSALDSRYVEHYFDVLVDDEIDNDLLCTVRPKVKQKGLFIKDPVDCSKPPQGDFSVNSVYAAPQEGTIPECDD